MRKIIAALFLLASFSSGQAANVNINQLPVAPSVSGADLFECLQSGHNHQCSAAQIQAYMATVFGTLASQNAPTGVLQCLHVSALGIVSGTGSDCGSGGGGGTPGGSNGQVQYNNAGVFGGYTNAQLTNLVNPATASLSGALPAWPNTTTSYFRGDGTYQTLAVAAVTGAAPLASPTFTGTVTMPAGFFHAPTATAGPNAVTGSAATAMASDSAPAIQLGSASQKGIVQVDGVTITASSGVITAPFSGGTVTSVASGCGVSTGGSPITTSGTVSANATINSQTGTSYTIASSDCGLLLELSNASSVAVSLPQATGSFTSGWYTTIINEGAGTATITPTTSTIDGSSTLTLAQFSSVDVISNGTNYITARGRSGGATTITAGSTATSGITSGNIIGSTSNLVVDTGVAYSNVATLSGSQVYTGANTFAEVLGKVTSQSGTTYTFAATDCGTEVTFTNSGAVTATLPVTLPVGCNIAVLQAGTGKVSVNGSAVTPATLHNAHSYTGTAAQWAIVGTNIEANVGGSAAVAILTGDGS